MSEEKEVNEVEETHTPIKGVCFIGETPNPILWIKNWTESKHVQVAPQETQIETYKVGSFKQDTSETDFSDFTF